MADIATPTPRRRNWLKIIAIAVGILFLLLIVLYFVVTSSGFIRGVILPRAGKAFNADITVSDISLSPFSEVLLKDLKVQPHGREPLLTSPEVHVRYRLGEILKGNYVIDLVSIKSPVLTLVERPDATSNLDPVMEALGESSDDPINMDLKKLVLSNGTIRYEKLPSAQGSYSSEVSDFNLNIDGLKTGDVGKITMSGNLTMKSEAPAPGTNGTMAGAIKGDLEVGLTPMLMPSVLKGSTQVTISQATGAYAMASGMAVLFDADVTSAEIRQLALRLAQGQQTLAQFAAKGPFSLEKMEGTLDVHLSNVDKQSLNLATAGSGMDFGNTTINSTNRIHVTNGGQSFSAAGNLSVNNFQVTRTNQTTPVLNLQAAYDATVDQAKSNLVLRTFTLNGNQSGKQFLAASLSAPMAVSWGDETATAGDAALKIGITDFNLADWRAFTGDSLSSGVVNSKMEVITRDAGKRVLFSHRSGISNLAMLMGSNQVANVSIVLAGEGEAADMDRFSSKYNLEVNHGRMPALNVTGAGSYVKSTEETKGDAKGAALIPVLLGMFQVPDAAFTSGTIEFNLNLQQKAENQQVQGQFNLRDLTGRYGSNLFQSFAAEGTVNAAMTPEKADLRKTTLGLSQGGKPGGSVELSGSYGLSNQVAQFNLSLKDLNQNVLVTFLQPALGDKALQSISLNGQAGGNYDPNKSSKITADFKVSNLVVKDPSGTVPASPLEASLAFETAIEKQVAEIRKGLLTLTPTDRAKNQVQLAGRLDMSNTNFTSGNIKMTSDAMDLTTYYDLFGGEASPASGAETTSPAPGVPPVVQTGQSPAPEQEPEPMVLPLTNFVAEVNFGKLFLKEVEITNLVVKTAINGGQIRVNPLQMNINGAPLNSTVAMDLGVPGYRYELAFDMTQVPFAPLVNTFTPERKGQLGGTLTASAQVKGAGTTGASLQKNLAGTFMIGTTNLNLAISEMRSPMLKTVINVIAIVPSIIKNPNTGISSLAGALFGGTTPAGGARPLGAWGDELMKSPVDIIQARGTMGSGEVNLEQAFVQSLAFQAEARGTIELADVLTNSAVNIPLNVAIRRSLAETVNMVPPGTPTNAVYVKLPDYVTIRGTVGDPKTDINKMALVGTALQQYGGSLGLDKKTGNVIQGLGGILTGRRPEAETNAPAATGTNAAPAPQTNAPAGGLLQGLGGLLGAPKPAETNQPSVTATNQPQTQTNPVGNLIEGLFGRPKKKQ